MICPFDRTECRDRCAYPCPGPHRRAPQRDYSFGVIRAYLLLVVLGIFLAVMVLAHRLAHGAEATFEQSIPTIGSVDTGMWPPDDTPRSQYAAAVEIMAIFRSCRTVAGEYDRQGKMRGFRVLCDF